MNEEVKRVTGGFTDREDTSEDHPMAIIMDITKAYPRVNRNILWHILRKLGMRERMLKTMKNLHEKTIYKVKGRNAMSESWVPQRGLREGCATSPILFSIFHACAIKRANEERRKNAEKENLQLGIPWTWKPGFSLPPKSQSKAMQSSENERIEIVESLFADDTTILGKKNEIFKGRDIVVDVMSRFEEKCHPDKEEHVYIGERASETTRMLGIFIGREKDTQERLKRGRQAVWNVRKRLMRTRLSRKTQAAIVETVVESSVLFDCGIRPWRIGEITKLQRVVDEAYRYIWSRKNKGPIKQQMEKENINMFGVRKVLNVTSLRSKIEKRSLQRIGHILRMDNSRTTKQVTLGWYQKEGIRRAQQSTVQYWRKIIGEAGVDSDNVEMYVWDRKKWRNLIDGRMKKIREWEVHMATIHKSNQREKNTIRRNERVQRRRQILMCDWEECGKVFRTKGGLKAHQRMKHRVIVRTFKCKKCGEEFNRCGVRENHEQYCQGTKRGTCPYCLRVLSISNMARHKRKCALTNALKTDYCRVDKIEGKCDTFKCDVCSEEISKPNKSRHLTYHERNEH